jgi:hypothetical protein
VFDWELTREAGGRVVARLEGTEVTVFRVAGGTPAAWRWEVRFADGQVQSGQAESSDQALEKGKRVAERFLT